MYALFENYHQAISVSATSPASMAALDGVFRSNPTLARLSRDSLARTLQTIEHINLITNCTKAAIAYIIFVHAPAILESLGMLMKMYGDHNSVVIVYKSKDRHQKSLNIAEFKRRLCKNMSVEEADIAVAISIVPDKQELQRRFINIFDLNSSDRVLIDDMICRDELPAPRDLTQLCFESNFGWLIYPLALVKSVAFALLSIRSGSKDVRELGTDWFTKVLQPLHLRAGEISSQTAAAFDVTLVWKRMGISPVPPHSFEQLCELLGKSTPENNLIFSAKRNLILSVTLMRRDHESLEAALQQLHTRINTAPISFTKRKTAISTAAQDVKRFWNILEIFSVTVSVNDNGDVTVDPQYRGDLEANVSVKNIDRKSAFANTQWQWVVNYLARELRDDVKQAREIFKLIGEEKLLSGDIGESVRNLLFQLRENNRLHRVPIVLKNTLQPEHAREIAIKLQSLEYWQDVFFPQQGAAHQKPTENLSVSTTIQPSLAAELKMSGSSTLQLDRKEPSVAVHVPELRHQQVAVVISYVYIGDQQHLCNRSFTTFGEFVSWMMGVLKCKPEDILLPRGIVLTDRFHASAFTAEILGANVTVQPMAFHIDHLFNACQRDDRTALVQLLPHVTLSLIDIKQHASGSPNDTLLHVSAAKGSVSCTRFLLDRMSCNVLGDKHRTPLHCAAAAGMTECVQWLLNCADIDVNAEDDNKQTPLFLAARFGFPLCVKMLLQKAGTYVDCKDIDLWTPLECVVQKATEVMMHDKLAFESRLKCVKLLLDHNASPLISARDRYSPFQKAVHSGDPRLIEPFWRKLSPQQKKDEFFATFAHQCDANIINLFLENGIQVNCTDSKGRTVLHHIAMSEIPGSYDLVRNLVDKRRADATMKDTDGNTALHLVIRAKMKKDHKAMAVLLERSSGDIQNNAGETPRTLAERNGYPSLFQNGTGTQVSRFQSLYALFKEKRNAVFQIESAPKKQLNQTNVAFMLSLAQWYEPRKRIDARVDEIVEAARSAGRNCINFAFLDSAPSSSSASSSSFLKQCEAYLLNQGYAELTNVYLFTAPLDALNWKFMKAPQYNDVHLTNWRAVVALNEAAKDVHCLFLRNYASVQERFQQQQLLEDPFPSLDMKEVIG